MYRTPYTDDSRRARHCPGLPLSDFLIREVRKIAEHPSAEEMAERLQQRAPYRGKMRPDGDHPRGARPSLIVVDASRSRRDTAAD